jgi:hypothetical protein
MEINATIPAVAITDFKEYSAIIRELQITASFVHDTMDILRDSNRFDGTIGTPTPYYAIQMNGLVQKAVNKQLSLLERLEDLTSVSPDQFHSTLGVVDMPKANQKLSEFED